MYIHEAIKLALEKKCHIHSTNEFLEKLYFEPANCFQQNIVIHRKNGAGKPAPHWNPKAEDLISDEWEIYEK